MHPICHLHTAVQVPSLGKVWGPQPAPLGPSAPHLFNGNSGTCLGRLGRSESLRSRERGPGHCYRLKRTVELSASSPEAIYMGVFITFPGWRGLSGAHSRSTASQLRYRVAAWVSSPPAIAESPCASASPSAKQGSGSSYPTPGLWPGHSGFSAKQPAGLDLCARARRGAWRAPCTLEPSVAPLSKNQSTSALEITPRLPCHHPRYRCTEVLTATLHH